MQTKITLLLFSVLILASCGKLDEVVQNDAAPRRAEGDTQPEQYQARGEAMPLTREAIASVLEAFQEPTVRQGMLIQEISAAYQGLDDSKTKNEAELKLADLSKVNRDLFKQCLVVTFTECGYDTDASVALLFGSEVDFKPDDFYYFVLFQKVVSSYVNGGAISPVSLKRRYKDLFEWGFIQQDTHDILVSTIPKEKAEDAGKPQEVPTQASAPSSEHKKDGPLPNNQNVPNASMAQKPEADGGQRDIPLAAMQNTGEAGLKLKIAELQGDLAVVNSKIEAERKRWQDANVAINAVTNNKTTPVVRNSPEHVQMYQAQVVIKQVEAGAPALKEEKSRLEAMIKSLQDSPPTPSAIHKTE